MTGRNVGVLLFENVKRFMARLRILAGANSTTHELVNAETITIGRGMPNGIALADLASSSRHSQLSKDSLGWRIVDLGSRNGTFVNGNQIKSPHLLQHGDQIQVARQRFYLKTLPRRLMPQSQSVPIVEQRSCSRW